MYRAQISGDDDSLRILCKNYPDVEHRDGIFYLKSSHFDTLNDSGRIREYAQKKLEKMIDILYLKFNKKFNAKITHIDYLKPDGSKIISLDADKIILKSSANVKRWEIERDTGEKIIMDSELLSDRPEPYIDCIERNTYIQDAFTHYNRDQNWVNLNKVYEIIEDNMDGKMEIVNRNWASQMDLEHFRCTAHNVEFSGDDARHGVGGKMSPQCQRILNTHGPMDLIRARKLINKIFNDWMDYICN